MKTILLSICIFVSINSFAQSVDITVSGNPIDTTNVVIVEDVKAEQLYSIGLEWFAQSYKNAKYVLQLQDKDAKVIMGKGTFGTLIGSKVGYTTYSVRLSFKDGKLKYDVFDVINDAYGLMKQGEITKAPWGAKGLMSKQYKKFQESSRDNLLMLANSITSYFKKPQTKNDW